MKIGRLYRTVRHLRLRQIAWRMVRRGPVRGAVSLVTDRVFGSPSVRFARWMRGIGTVQRIQRRAPGNPFAAAPPPNGRITADGIDLDDLREAIDPTRWTGVQPLRAYRLHSHLFFLHPDSEATQVWHFLARYLDYLASAVCGDSNRGGAAWASHSVSLRIVSWVRYLAGTAGKPELASRLERALAFHAAFLLRRVEWETDGNHLIDNACALILSGWYLGKRRALRRGRAILSRELPRQVLPSGFHDERSFMYHALALDRLLDVAAVREANGIVRGVTGAMLHWLKEAHRAGVAGAAVNDDIRGFVPSVTDLQRYAAAVGVIVPETPEVAAFCSRARCPHRGAPGSNTGGIHIVRRGAFSLLFDAAPIGPDHVPGHAHADTLQLLVWHDGTPLFVDTGTSTYDAGERRAFERGTAAHNTVALAALGRGTALIDSSEIWGAFRVGRRARIVADEDAATETDGDTWERRAVHDGYRRWGVLHERTVRLDNRHLVVGDRLVGIGGHVGRAEPLSGAVGVARWHVAPHLAAHLSGTIAAFRLAGLTITISGAERVWTEESRIAAGFMRTEETVTIAAEFTSEMETVIETR